MAQERPRLRVRRVTLAADRVLHALDARLKRIAFEGAPEFRAYPYVPRLLDHPEEGYGWTVKLLWNGCEPAVTIYQRALTTPELVVVPRYAGDVGPLSFDDKAHSVEFGPEEYGRTAQQALDTLKRLYYRETQLRVGSPV